MKLIKIIVILILCFSTTAQADFRKALDALQKIQGEEMLLEVEDAEKKQNNDGISLFLNTLSNRFDKGAFYISQRRDTTPNRRRVIQTELLAKSSIPKLMMLLAKATLTADPDTQYDFAILQSKIDGKRISNAKLQALSKQGVKRLKSSLNGMQIQTFEQKTLDQRNLREEFEFIKSSAQLGNIDSIAFLAQIYLQWEAPYSNTKVFFNVVAKNPAKGMYWLKRYATNAYFTDYFASCKLAQEYHSGNTIAQDNRQAYLWYIETMAAASTSYAGYDKNKCGFNGLQKMALSGDLNKIDPKLVALFKTDNKRVWSYIKSLSGTLEQPKDFKIKSNIYNYYSYGHALVSPLQNNTVYSIHTKWYSLAVYKDGKVQFEGKRGGNHDNHTGGSYISGREQWQIKKIEVEQLLNQLDQAGVFNSPKYYSFVPWLGGPAPNVGFIKIRKHNQTKTIRYRREGRTPWTPLLAKVFKIQESIIPTQRFRCGSPRDDQDHKDCIEADARSFKKAATLD